MNIETAIDNFPLNALGPTSYRNNPGLDSLIPKKIPKIGS
jgi:hypothetical protein